MAVFMLETLKFSKTLKPSRVDFNDYKTLKPSRDDFND